jgi:phytoene synthase
MSADSSNLEQTAKQITRKSRSNFYLALFALPKAKREALYSVYAFCRHTDDLADQNLSAEQRKQQLAEWRTCVKACLEGEASAPVLQSLALCVERFRIPKKYLEELIDGVEMDLSKTRYETFDDLYPYCYRVASVVGLICIEVFGYSNPKTKEFAEYLGVALQLTNILRYVGIDAAQDRIYLPQEDLRRFGVTEEDILRHRYTEAFARLAAFQADRAESFYRKAFDCLPPEDRKNMLAAEIIAGIYHRLLARIRERNYRVYEKKIRIPDWRKLLIAFRLWFRSLFR